MSGHECPAPGCTERVPSRMYACRRHWYSIPPELRSRLWRAVKGPGIGSREHFAAMAACDEHLERSAT